MTEIVGKHQLQRGSKELWLYCQQQWRVKIQTWDLIGGVIRQIQRPVWDVLRAGLG